ncbi:MAG: hypothetical protein CL904_00045 [Dehalococcoidia bacterium]|nr:hypothetical protein [Dehalococcoidia bacterium]
MISKYISTWWLVLFYIWLLGYFLNIKTITDNINVYYTTILLFLGFMGINFYYTQYLKRTFKPKLWLTLLYYHLTPILILITLNKRNHKGAMKTLIISILLYIFHMVYLKESIYNVYFIEKLPQSWEDIDIRCKSEENKEKIFCILNSYKERYL